jgi:TolB-like protein
MLKMIVLVSVLAWGCSFAAGNLQSRRSTDLEARKIRRIAVLPPTSMAPEQKPSGPFAPSSPAEAKTLEKEAPDSLARLLYSTMASMSNWQIVSESEVREIGQSVQAPSEAARLKQIGDRVYADAVITGRIQRFRERVGDEWGVKSPASVAFVLDLVDVRRGDVVWSARFDETQKSLSENILAIGEIGQRGVRWLTAEQLAHEGIKKAVAQLHQILIRPPTS